MSPRTTLCSLMLVMLTTKPSFAADEAPKVLLVRPARSEAAVGYALVRVRGELVTEGFDVTIVETTPGTTSAEAMAAAAQDSASATIGLFLSADGRNAELWVVDKLTAKTVVRELRTTTSPTEQLSDVLAIRVVELLRASLLESVVAQRRATTPKASTTPPPTNKRAASWAAKPLQLAPDPAVRFHLGEAVVWNPTQLGPAWLLVGRFEWLLSSWIHPRISFIGFGTRPELIRAEGQANVQQGLGLVEIGIAPFMAKSWLPELTLGAGTWRTVVEGRASWPYEGTNYGQWSVAFDAGLGWTLNVTHVLAVVAEGHATFVTPSPVIRFAGHEVARIGRPVTSATLTLAVAL